MLKDDPANELLLQAKTAALLHEDQYKAALEIMKSHPEVYVFETAYCYLQLGDISKSLEMLTKSESKDIRVLYLLGQIVLLIL